MPQLPFIRDLPRPGIVVVLILILLLTLYWLWAGYRRIALVREIDDSWARAFVRSGPGLLGLWMLVAFLGAPLFFLLNVFPAP